MLAQEEPPPVQQPQTAEVMTVGSDFAAILDEQMPSSYDWLQATLNVEEKAAGVSWAPFLANREYNPWYSETRVQVGQKDGRTSLGLTLRWNPLSPRTDDAIEEWGRLDLPSYGGPAYATLRTLRRRATQLQDEDLELQTAGVVNARLNVERLERALDDQKLSPERRKELGTELETATNLLATLRRDARIAQRDKLRILIREERQRLETAADPKNGAPPKTDPLQVSDLREVAAILSEIDTLLAHLSSGAEYVATLDAEIAAVDKQMAKKYAAAVADFEQILYSKPLPVLSVTYGGTLFGGLGGAFVDADADGLDDAAHVLAERSLLFSGQIRFGERKKDGRVVRAEQQVTAGVGRSWKWASAEEGTPTSKSDNFAVSYARRLMVLDKNYKKSDDYLSSLFVPSIVGGLSAEYADCGTEVANCQDKAESIFALTPFLDVKVKKAAQFRVGLTWKKFSGSDIAEDELGVVTLISLQLGVPK